MKTLVMALVGTLIGLLGGVVIGYSLAPLLQSAQGQASQNQIIDLQNQISDLQSQLSERDGQVQTLQDQISEKTSEIQTLQQKVSDLEALLGPIKRGDWNLIETFQGSSGLKTDYFNVAGADLRINWTWSSSIEQFALFSISLYKEGHSIYTEFFLDLQDVGTTFAHNISSDNYYLDISAANLD